MDPHTKLLYEKLTDSVCKQVSHIIYELGKNNTSSFWTAKHILLFAYSVFFSESICLLCSKKHNEMEIRLRGILIVTAKVIPVNSKLARI